METVNINASAYKMKGSPMQRNFNIGIATKTGMSGLVSKDSPMQLAWLAAIGKAVAAGGKAVAAGAAKAGAAVAKSAKFVAKGAKTLGAKVKGAFTKGGAKGATTKTRTAVTSSTSKGLHAGLDAQTKLNLKGKIKNVKEGISKFAKSKTGKAVGAQLFSSMTTPPPPPDQNRPSENFASMKIGTGGSSPYTLRNSVLKFMGGPTLFNPKIMEQDRYKTTKAKLKSGAINTYLTNTGIN